MATLGAADEIGAALVGAEAVDPVFQAKMLEMLKQTDRAENSVGWYHSHPGFGCWLSATDINTQQVFFEIFSQLDLTKFFLLKKEF